MIISLAFAISGLFAGIVAILWLGRIGSVVPGIGLEPLLVAFIATVIGAGCAVFWERSWVDICSP